MLSEIFSLSCSLNFPLSKYLLSLILILIIFNNLRIIVSKSLIEIIVLMSTFSLLISLSYLLMDAPDVAMTEVALGACLSTIVLLNFIQIIEKKAFTQITQTKFILSLFICLIFFGVLIWVSSYLPEYGLANSPVHSNTSKYYIDNTYSQIGLPSFVAAILASYRGFDTLGETTVILIAGISVLLLISDNQIDNKKNIQNKTILKDYVIIEKITSFILPYIFLYSLYIQINGEISPGGGFQAGVIFASMIIGFDLIYGRNRLELYFPVNLLLIVAILGVVLYAGVGVISFFMNDSYLNYYSLSENKHFAQEIGISIIEIGVGLTVASVMCLIYSLLDEKS